MDRMGVGHRMSIQLLGPSTFGLHEAEARKSSVANGRCRAEQLDHEAAAGTGDVRHREASRTRSILSGPTGQWPSRKRISSAARSWRKRQSARWRSNDDRRYAPRKRKSLFRSWLRKDERKRSSLGGTAVQLEERFRLTARPGVLAAHGANGRDVTKTLARPSEPRIPARALNVSAPHPGAIMTVRRRACNPARLPRWGAARVLETRLVFVAAR